MVFLRSNQGIPTPAMNLTQQLMNSALDTESPIQGRGPLRSSGRVRGKAPRGPGYRLPCHQLNWPPLGDRCASNGIDRASPLTLPSLRDGPLPCMGLSVSRAEFISCCVKFMAGAGIPWFDRKKTIPSSRPESLRSAARKRCQGWPQATAKRREATLTARARRYHGPGRGTTRFRRLVDCQLPRQDDLRRACQWWRTSATTLYAVAARGCESCGIRTMMQSCASAARLQGGGPILSLGVKAMGTGGSPPPRIVWALHRVWEHRNAEPIGHSERGGSPGADSIASLTSPVAAPHPPAPRRPSHSATGRSAACGPGRRSWSCGCRDVRWRSGPGTIA